MRVEFDTERSRIKINNFFEKRLQLPGFSPVRDIYLTAIVMLFSSLLRLENISINININAFCFRRDKNDVFGTKKGQLGFSERN